MATKRDYVETIVQVMQEVEDEEEERYRQESKANKDNVRLPIQCRFIVSVDRSQSIQQAAENVDLAIALHATENSLVVGMGLGGNPTQQDVATFRPHLQRAREAGLLINVDCAEVPCDEKHPAAYKEAQDILDFAPDRLGHALLLPASLQTKLLRIPNETCPTSNVMTLELNRHVNGAHLTLLQGLAQHDNLRTKCLIP